MALTADRTRYWYQATGPARSNHCTTLLASATIYHGAVAMEVDGKAQKVLSGSSMAAKCTLMAGADANGGSYISARQPNTRVSFTDGAAEKIEVSYGATTDIAITYVAASSTANSIAQLVRWHGLANSLIRIKPQGTGASAPAAVLIAAGAVAYIRLLGVPQRRLVESTGSDATLPMDEGVFDLGVYRMAGSSAPTLAGGLVSISDDATITKTIDPLDLLAPLRAIDGSAYYVDLAEAR